MKLIDLTGQRFGLLTVLYRTRNVGKEAAWHCKCECGEEVDVTGYSLRSGKRKYCDRRNHVDIHNEWIEKLSVPSNDLNGRRFGRLVVVKYAGKGKWKCLCDCGNETTVLTSSLKSGRTSSCGCLYKEKRNGKMTHGLSKTRLYRVWLGMRSRCNDPNNLSYKRYGGRGISVCDEWNSDFKSFYDWAMNTGYDPDAPKGACTIDRINNGGNYCPENCRWITLTEQQKNKRKRVGSNASRMRPVELLDDDGNVIRTFDSIKSGADYIGCAKSLVRGVCIGKTHTTHGAKWRFADIASSEGTCTEEQTEPRQRLLS